MHIHACLTVAHQRLTKHATFTSVEVFGVSTALTARATETHTANLGVSRLLLLQKYRYNPKVRHVKNIL